MSRRLIPGRWRAPFAAARCRLRGGHHRVSLCGSSPSMLVFCSRCFAWSVDVLPPPQLRTVPVPPAIPVEAAHRAVAMVASVSELPADWQALAREALRTPGDHLLALSWLASLAHTAAGADWPLDRLALLMASAQFDRRSRG